MQGWDKMISEIYRLHNTSSGMQLSYTEWLKHLEIAEPRLSSQLLSHGQTGDVKLHQFHQMKVLNYQIDEHLSKPQIFLTTISVERARTSPTFCLIPLVQ